MTQQLDPQFITRTIHKSSAGRLRTTTTSLLRHAENNAERFAHLPFGRSLYRRLSKEPTASRIAPSVTHTKRTGPSSAQSSRNFSSRSLPFKSCDTAVQQYSDCRQWKVGAYSSAVHQQRPTGMRRQKIGLRAFSRWRLDRSEGQLPQEQEVAFFFWPLVS